MKRLARTLCAVAVAGGAALAASFAVAPYAVPEFDSVRGSWQASDAWLLDRSGERLSRVRIDHTRRRGDWVAVADVSPALVSMVVASEDRRFREHHGVDWMAIPAAARQTLAGERRGGSTLTMQLAAYLNPALEASGRRSVIDKWRQMRQALAIERRWGKEQVLEAWLNLTPFRGEVEGVDAAARSLYGKRAAGLDRVESALLAALVRSPGARGARVAKRACRLLAATPVPLTLTLSPQGGARETSTDNLPPASASGAPHLSARGGASESPADNECLIAQGFAAGGLKPGRLDSDLDGAAPHLARKLLKHPGESVTSTLDARLQRFAVATLQRHIRELRGRHVEDGALVVLDNATGEVLAWVGSTGELSAAREVDGVVSPRLAGSTLKPFLYAAAIGDRLLTAASVLDDSPLAVTLPTGLYVPQNYDRAFKGKVSLRQSLASSLNVPAVRTLALVGYERFYRTLKGLGFDALTRDADHYGYSLALGGAEVTLVQLANAYRALANGGEVSETQTTPIPTFPLKWKEGFGAEGREVSEGNLGFPPRRSPPEGARRALDPRAVFIVSDILADPAARALTFGFASPLATRYRASVKTGTSKDMRDNWAVGYAGRYTVGVWVGNFSGAPMHDVSGVDGAAPVWREVMDYLQEGGTPAQPEAPAGLVRTRITYAGGVEPERDEWFIAGTEQARVVALPAGSTRAAIETPAQGAIYAIDPDIPRDRQRLAVTARGAPKGSRFVFDDGRQASADKPLLWLPPPGRREVVLVGRDGRELDRVTFELRGIAARKPR